MINKHKTIRINTQLDICDPMQYPIIFPNGELGWTDRLIQTGTKSKRLA
jgi:hypothetical protein